MLYFDTAYLVRLHTRDAGWEQVRALAATDNLACSVQGQAEAVAAFHRKFRERAITQKELSQIIAEFERDSRAGAFIWLPLSPAVIARVVKAFISLPVTTVLRAADAIHLATAAESRVAEVYSNDTRLLAAANHFGLKGVNVI